MNFLGIGPFELLLILVIATIVLGPERMAQAGRTLGRLYAQYRVRWQKDVDEMTRELRRELAMLQREMEDIRQTAESEIRSAQTAVEGVIDTAASEIETTEAALKNVAGEGADQELSRVGSDVSKEIGESASEPETSPEPETSREPAAESEETAPGEVEP